MPAQTQRLPTRRFLDESGLCLQDGHGFLESSDFKYSKVASSSVCTPSLSVVNSVTALSRPVYSLVLYTTSLSLVAFSISFSFVSLSCVAAAASSVATTSAKFFEKSDSTTSSMPMIPLPAPLDELLPDLEKYSFKIFNASFTPFKPRSSSGLFTS